MSHIHSAHVTPENFIHTNNLVAERREGRHTDKPTTHSVFQNNIIL
jgi:hypothetical protein